MFDRRQTFSQFRISYLCFPSITDQLIFMYIYSANIPDIGECMILLADKYLLELPLEALSIFQDEAISSLSRDFSLQLLYNRIHKEESGIAMLTYFFPICKVFQIFSSIIHT